jgi:hypothetical protein
MRAILLGSDDSIISKYDAEIKFDKYRVYILQRLGKNKGAKITYGHNMIDINHKTSDEKELESILFGFFGEDNVKYNYFDKDRYPFKCDFYIPSEDLFIELHAGWEHQGHPFDNSNLEDISILEEIKSKQNKSEYYSNVIYQWTELDVRKLNTFKENNLNYIIGYSVGEIYEILKDKFN